MNVELVVVVHGEEDEVAVFRIETDVNVLSSIFTSDRVVTVMSANADLTILANSSLPDRRSKQGVNSIQIEESQF